MDTVTTRAGIFSMPIVKVNKGEFTRATGEVVEYQTVTKAITSRVLPPVVLDNPTVEQIAQAKAEYAARIKAEFPTQSFYIWARVDGLKRKTAKWVAVEKGVEYVTPQDIAAAQAEFDEYKAGKGA